MYRTIPQLMVDAASRAPDRVWLRTDGTTLTFGAAASRVGGIAAQLRDRGVKHGDLVLLTARTTPPYLLSWLAITALGAIAVPTNPASTEAEFAGLIGQVDPQF
ncbi:MAG TPA: AMP-binding protein, partial [Jatrophihabitantaceae bacterium]